MSLARFDTHGCLISEINNYLANNLMSFSQIKDLFLNQAVSAEIQTGIDAKLINALISDIAHSTTLLNEQAYKLQLSQDEKESNKEQKQLLIDKRLHQRFNSELTQLNMQLNKNSNNQSIIFPIYTPISNLHYNQNTFYPNRYATHQVPNTNNQVLYEKRQLIINKLREINTRIDKARDHQEERGKRLLARIEYQHTKQAVEKTLSLSNRSILKKNIEEYTKALRQRKEQLYQECVHNLLPLLIQEFQKHMPSAQLKANEIAAINALLKLMQQHIRFQQESSLLENSLKAKKGEITALMLQRQHHQQDIERLNKQSQKTHTIRKHLMEINVIYTQNQTRYNQIKNRLYLSTLLLSAFCCISSIPFILTLSGILIGLSPLFLYGLIYTPFLLSSAGTIGTGVASIVYTLKIKNSQQQFQSNKIVLSHNNRLLKNSEQTLSELQQKTLPKLDSAIKKEAAVREELSKLVIKNKQNALDCLNQAQRLTPSSLEKESFFKEERLMQSENATQINTLSYAITSSF